MKQKTHSKEEPAHGPIKPSLTGMAYGGAALGRYQGQVIFVPGAIPGETVLAQR